MCALFFLMHFASRRFITAVNRVKNFMLALAGVILVIPDGFNVPADPDLWWHLKAGMNHIASCSIARMDSFSFTAFQAPWTNHEWLSEVFFGMVFSAAGDS
ncbi:MAG: hypothetical protein NC930_07955, partial [Candidatus Omnitrophica bacterium]|nr:hypothetical protein [Candidatus Omnitrophota bacterium]